MTRATGFISCFKRISQHSNIFDFENWLQNCKTFIALCCDGMQGVVKLHVGLHKYCSTHCSPTCRHGAPRIAGSHLPACWIFAPGTLLHRHDTVVYNDRTYYRITVLYFVMQLEAVNPNLTQFPVLDQLGGVVPLFLQKNWMA